jgi:phospholipase/carboxylesterase
MTALSYDERPASGKPDGLLVLHHGRGTDERDLLGLADALDPERRLHVAAPRAPLALPGWPGYHWYVVPRVGYPDFESFHAAHWQLAAFHDALWQRTGVPPERTVLGGFSMGAVMSYALGLTRERPAPAGIIAFSGFIPTVDGWQPTLEDRRRLRVFIAHGRGDEIIPIDFARRAHEQLLAGGLEVDYHESEVGHQIDAANLTAGANWLALTLGFDHSAHGR